jgi:hypothetical protein
MFLAAAVARETVVGFLAFFAGLGVGLRLATDFLAAAGLAIIFLTGFGAGFFAATFLPAGFLPAERAGTGLAFALTGGFFAFAGFGLAFFDCFAIEHPFVWSRRHLTDSRNSCEQVAGFPHRNPVKYFLCPFK